MTEFYLKIPLGCLCPETLFMLIYETDLQNERIIMEFTGRLSANCLKINISYQKISVKRQHMCFVNCKLLITEKCSC